MINDTRLLSCPAVALMVVGGMLNYVDYLNNLRRDERMMHTARASKPQRCPSVTNVTCFPATEIPLKHGAAILLPRTGGPADASRKGAADSR